MIQTTGNSTKEIQWAISALEDLIQSQFSEIDEQDVLMMVDPGSGGVSHGAVVGMTGDNLVDLSNANIGWIGVNAGPDAVAGKEIPVRGGRPVEVRLAAGQILAVAGGPLYFDPTNLGIFTTIQPPNSPAIGIIYDASGYSFINGGTVKALINSNFGGAAPPPPPVFPCLQPLVNLGTAFDFVVLGGSTVTNTGPSVVTGDLGLSPGSALVGFPPGSVVGNTHITDPVAAQAQLDLTVAYNDAAARGTPPCIYPIVGDLGGLTLSPGTYRTAVGIGISSGDLTLDGGNNPNAVFVFQAGSTLTVGPGRKVILINQAKAKNVFWLVGTSATLNTTSSVKGTIMALASITLDTGATLEGRALARNGAVTLDSNAVTKPAP